MHVVMTAAHGGYDSERVPLGGGAAVCERLCRLWAGSVRLSLIGSGPTAPPGVEYVRVAGLGERIPSQLSELEYAAFSRRFEEGASQQILAMRPRPVVLAHDISEGPSFARLARAGVDCVSILHVDVVDYFQRFYLGDLLPTFWWTWLHRKSSLLPWPNLLQLVFDKQQQAADHCRYLVVPSARMKSILQESYPEMPAGRVRVIPWGAPVGAPPPSEVEAAKERLRLQWELHPRTPLLVTLSRISPEKSQDALLRALKIGEERGEIPPGLTVAIVGAPSYMMGQRFLARLQGLAGSLRRVRVIFAGHLGGADKRAALELASQFVVCSRHESYGLTIMEAMAAGCPIVAVRSYGVDATVDESCGRVVERGSDGQLWEAISGLLREPEVGARLGQAALQRASSEGFEEAARQLLQLLQGSHLAWK